jgi:hypothetical protein
LPAFILPQKPDEVIRFATGWTDDMFMASAVLSRVDNGAHAAAVGKLLTSYAEKLQRPDGLFIHAVDGPHAWGRGNGFALLGLTEALTSSARELGRSARAFWRSIANTLRRWRRTSRMTAAGARWWTSRRVIAELTVTGDDRRVARARRHARLDRSRTFDPIINRGWAAVAARVNADGTVKKRLLWHRRGTDRRSTTSIGPSERRRRSRRRDGNARGDRDRVDAPRASMSRYIRTSLTWITGCVFV